jgi:type I restriction enzyme S subunit
MTRLVPLAEVVEINPRIRCDLADDAPVSFIPMAAVSDAGGGYSEEERTFGEVKKGYTPFLSGDLILAKITPCMENGKVALLDGLRHKIGFGSTEFHVLRAGPDLDRSYLFHMLWNPRFRYLAERRMTGAGGQRRVPTNFLREYEIPVPTLQEQKRIATILDKADAIRRKRRDVVAEIEVLLRSSYLEIVGFKNPEFTRWQQYRIEELAASKPGAMRTGPFGSDLRHSEFVDKGIAVLGIDNAVMNRFDWGERRFITQEKYDALRRYKVFPDDIIITIMGTTGRSAVVPKDIPEAITTKHLATITLNQKIAVPEFISFAIHSDPKIIRQIRRANKGAIMEGLNLGIIKGLEIALPPMEQQMRFADVFRRLDSQRAQLQQPSGSGEALYASLAQRAVRGEL